MLSNLYSVVYSECCDFHCYDWYRYASCRHAECRYAECRCAVINVVLIRLGIYVFVNKAREGGGSPKFFINTL
jgi:hypothetical protein